jgi:hypothetical protein
MLSQDSRTRDDATPRRAPAFPVPGRKALACLAAIASLFAAAALGQGLACPDIENDAERLACYDRALRPNRPPGPAAQAPAVAPTVTAPAAAAAAPTGAAVAPAAAAASTTAPAAVTPPPAVASVPAAAPANAPAADETITVVIADVKLVQGRPVTFTTADGTVWVQNDSQTIRNVPETPFDAELKPGALGSRFLLPKGQSRSIRVRLAR